MLSENVEKKYIFLKINFILKTFCFTFVRRKETNNSTVHNPISALRYGIFKKKYGAGDIFNSAGISLRHR